MTAVRQVAIARQLLANHLGRYTAASRPETERLLDFRFSENDLNLVDGGMGRLVFHVEFAVLPSSKNTAWMAGNGKAGVDGWIVDKNVFLTAVREGDVWRLQSLSTSP